MERQDRPVTTWRKSTYSGGNGGNCVEVGTSNETIMVRDTKNREGASLSLSPAAWRRLTATLKTAS